MCAIAITGASGFIGSSVARAFLTRGRRVVALARRDVDEAAGAELRFYDLESGALPRLDDVTVLIHAARSHKGDNVESSRRLFAHARAQGVKRICFISSLSAQAGSESKYGREKAAIEAFLDAKIDLIVRPGLVIGAGGLVASMTSVIRRFHVAPVVEGGTQPVYTIGVVDLAQCIAQLMEDQASGVFTLAAPEAIAMLDLYRALAHAARTPLALIPVPYALLLIVAPETARSLRNLRVIEIPVYPELRTRIRPFTELSVLA